MMQSISAILIKPFTKLFIKALAKLICIALLFITQTAHADFRKALDAYMARDGATMLKEVKDAVDKKNDDGLMLFLNAMAWDAQTSEHEEITYVPKSTIKTILSKPQWDEMRELLVQATKNSTVDAQYYLITYSQFGRELRYKRFMSLKSSQDPSSTEEKNTTAIIPRLSNEDSIAISKDINEEYVKHGSRMAAVQSNYVKAAEAGDPFSQLQLGLKYLNSNSGYGCGNSPKDPLCQTKDETKGYEWLKRAAKSYESSGHSDFDLFASEMCQLLHTTANGDPAKLKQAYLWGLMGGNERTLSQSFYCLTQMHDSGSLKLVASQLDTSWGDVNKWRTLIFRAELAELPVWVIEIRKELAKENLPVFIYAGGPELELYADGRVLFGSINFKKDLLMKVKPKTVKAFLTELKKTGFYQWTMADSSAGICAARRCGTIDMQFTTRDGTKVHRLLFSVIDEKPLDKKLIDTKRMAILKTLVDKYFPTQKLRCGLGNSEQKKQACLEYETQWKTMAKEGKQNGDFKSY